MLTYNRAYFQELGQAALGTTYKSQCGSHTKFQASIPSGYYELKFRILRPELYAATIFDARLITLGG